MHEKMGSPEVGFDVEVDATDGARSPGVLPPSGSLKLIESASEEIESSGGADARGSIAPLSFSIESFLH